MSTTNRFKFVIYVEEYMTDALDVSVTVILPTLNEEEGVGDTIDAIPKNFCKNLEILIIDGNSKDKTREISEEKGARVHIESRKGYGRAYRTGFAIASGDIIVTMDADCTYPAEVIPELVQTLLERDLSFITCDRLTLAEKGAMSGLHGFGNWALSITGRMLFWNGIKDSQSGMWVFRKSIFENEKLRPTNDGMPLSEEIKLITKMHLEKGKFAEISVPYRKRVGDAEINTWGDGWKNFKFFFAKRLGINKTLTKWGPKDE